MIESLLQFLAEHAGKGWWIVSGAGGLFGGIVALFKSGIVLRVISSAWATWRAGTLARREAALALREGAVHEREVRTLQGLLEYLNRELERRDRDIEDLRQQNRECDRRLSEAEEKLRYILEQCPNCPARILGAADA